MVFADEGLEGWLGVGVFMVVRDMVWDRWNQIGEGMERMENIEKAESGREWVYGEGYEGQ